MSKGSAQQLQTGTLTQDPSALTKPYYKEALKEAQRLFQSGAPQFFPEATYVPLSGQTEAALKLQEERALAGSPLLKQAQGQVGDILSGKFLDPESNPYLKAAYEKAAGSAQGTLGSQFASAGRYGSGAMAETAGKRYGDIATDIYGGAYERERQRQMSALGMAPGLAQADYYDIQQLGNVGQQREAFEEAKLADAMNRFNFEQQKPFNKLSQYMSYLGMTPGYTQTSSQPIFRSPGANLLGGALGGAQLGSLMGLGPWGIAGSALGGGLLAGAY